MKKEIHSMFLIIFYTACIHGVILFYLQRKFVFSTLWSEVQQLEEVKKKLIREINKIKLETAEYSSIYRVNQLILKEFDSREPVEQKITTLVIPKTPQDLDPTKIPGRVIQVPYKNPHHKQKGKARRNENRK